MNEKRYNHIDLTFLEGFAGGDNEKMVKYINMFINGAPPMIETMKQQCADKSWKQLRTTAHSLKPQAGYMGANGLKDIFLRIEKYAGEEVNIEAIPGLITEADTLSKVALLELKDAVSNLS